MVRTSPGTSIGKVSEGSRLTLGELEHAVAAADEGALLLPPRILRRVIREEHRLLHLRLNLPHGTSYTILRERLQEIVDSSELANEVTARLPDWVILLVQPDSDELDFTPAVDILTRYWRWLFHARVHLHVERQRAEGKLDCALLRRWLGEIGMTEFAEARTVLTHEGRLFPDADDWAVFTELAATYLELRHFSPGAIEHYLPALNGHPHVEGVLAEVIDVESLLAQTRLPGARTSSVEVPQVEGNALATLDGLMELQLIRRSRRQSPRMCRHLVSRSDKAALRGNFVRACMLLERARKYAAEKEVHRLRAALRGNLVRLVGSLQEALELPDAEIDSWRSALAALVARGAVGIRSREARLLFDLQKILVDHKRRLFKIDTWGWIRSLGRRPLRRGLPQLTEVVLHKHLRAALRKATTVRIPDEHRQTLHRLLRRAEERSEQRLRLRLRPLMADALEKAELLPNNTVERVAARKLVEELIDRVLDRGFLAMGDLRDAVARNNLKARDVRGPRDLFTGDQLLAADRKMAEALDGVYRHGEVYLRGMQHLSSLAFGTNSGRLLMRYLILPFGGAYLVEAGVKHMVQLVAGKELPVEHAQPGASSEFLTEHMPIVLLLGIFLLLLINVESFRTGLAWLLRNFGRGVRFMVRELPARLMQMELVRRFLESRCYRWTVRFAIKPLVVTALLWWAMPRLVPRWNNTPPGVGMTFLGVNLLLNSRLGRDLEELASDWVGRVWHWLGVQVIARLFWLIMDVFRASVEATERLLYTVDEWLRFRSGEGRVALVIKAVLGAFWFFVAYVTRFCVNLLIEPQVNPIKHFPVVTVSHKVLIPFIPSLAGVFMLAMDKELAVATAGVIIFCIPGIFGFFAWELRENWRLYAANRPRVLQPVTVGKHGESMRGLLLPGLHSGAIPKRYSKLRNAEREAAANGRWSLVRKHLAVLEELHIQVRRFVERDLLWLLNEAGCWNGARIYLARTELATNRVRVELRLDEMPAAMVLDFGARDGWLLGGMSGCEVIARLPFRQREALETAVTGLYKAAGIDLVREEIESQLPAPPPLYDFREEELIVWPAEFPETTVRYDLNGQQSTALRTVEGPVPPTLPVLDVPRVLFRQIPVAWSRWVQAWESLASNNVHREPAPAPNCLLASDPATKVLP